MPRRTAPGRPVRLTPQTLLNRWNHSHQPGTDFEYFMPVRFTVEPGPARTADCMEIKTSLRLDWTFPAQKFRSTSEATLMNLPGRGTRAVVWGVRVLEDGYAATERPILFDIRRCIPA
jgi:hypothetical protein